MMEYSFEIGHIAFEKEPLQILQWQPKCYGQAGMPSTIHMHLVRKDQGLM